MNDRLDHLLDAAAPRVVAPSEALRRDLEVLVANTEATARRGRRRAHRLGVVGLALAGLLGAGGVAAAAGWVPMPWYDDPSAVHGTHHTPSGESCQVTFAARPFEDLAHPVTPAGRAAALEEAQDFLDDVDVARLLEKMSPSAAQVELEKELSRHLAAKGLSTWAVGVALADHCPTPETER